jgi:aspartyl-tRNA(Asn)/glutamyl-tRNA(Gln) amidotransferase subunit A
MTAGSPIWRDHVAGEDAEVTRRLRRSGAIILGKLQMHEWALGATGCNPHYGPVRNPWDTSRITGGSSSGSGAAIAADLALGTLGSDTGGSVRIPGALTGVCGLRPTSGLISNRGVVPLCWTLDTVGPLARSAEDVAYLLASVGGYDAADPTSRVAPPEEHPADLRRGVKGLRIGVLTGFFQRDASPEVWAPVSQAAHVFAELGALVDDADLPEVEATIPWTSEIILAEAAAFHRERLEERPEDFGQDVLTRLRAGAARSAPQYAIARQEARRWRRLLAESFTRYDLLVGPTCAIPAPTIQESDGVVTTRLLIHFTYPFSLAGVPSMSIPCGFTSSGLPVGLQIVGRPWQESLLVQAAWAYQQVTDWHLRRPAM